MIMYKILVEKKIFIFYLFISALTTISMFLTFKYLDAQTLLAHAVTGWDAVFSGNPSSFYALKLENARDAVQPDGLLTPVAMFPIMIWSLPVWLTHTFNGNYAVSSLGCIYYYKIVLFLFTILLAYAACSIIKYFVGEDEKENQLLTAIFIISSPELLLCTMYAGQDEIFYIAFMALAINSFIRKNNKWFMIWSVCAVACCDIMLAPVLALILISNKKFLSIILKTVVLLIPRTVWALATIGAEYKSYLEGGDTFQVSEIFNVLVMDTTTGQASIAAIAFVLILLYSFNLKEDDDKEYMRKAVWIIASMMTVIAFLMENHFYRLFLYMPFVIVLIMISENKKINTFMYMLIIYIRMFTGGYNSPMTLNTEYVAEGSFAQKLCDLFGSDKYNVYDCLTTKLIEKAPILESLVPTMNGIAIAGIVVILYLTFKNKKKDIDIPFSRSVINGLIVFCMPVYLLLFYMLLFK